MVCKIKQWLLKYADNVEEFSLLLCTSSLPINSIFYEGQGVSDWSIILIARLKMSRWLSLHQGKLMVQHKIKHYSKLEDFPVAQMVKNLPADRERESRRPGFDPWFGKVLWRREWQPSAVFSILACRIPWTEDPGRLQSVGLQRVRHNWATNTTTTNICNLWEYSSRIQSLTNAMYEATQTNLYFGIEGTWILTKQFVISLKVNVFERFTWFFLFFYPSESSLRRTEASDKIWTGLLGMKVVPMALGNVCLTGTLVTDLQLG